jgi:hypothetical protein
MEKNLLTFQLTGKKLKRKEKLFITLTITQKGSFLVGCGLNKMHVSKILTYGILNLLEQHQDYYHTI